MILGESMLKWRLSSDQLDPGLRFPRFNNSIAQQFDRERGQSLTTRGFEMCIGQNIRNADTIQYGWRSTPPLQTSASISGDGATAN